MVTKAAFLDRDGVLNANRTRGDRLVAPVSFTEFELLPHVARSVDKLKSMGFFVVVCTNQPDQATGLSSPTELDAMHAYLRANVAIDDIFVCPHIDADNCDCRKPKPGLLTQAAHKHDIILSKSYMIGDRWRDINAGRSAGVRATFLVNGGPDDIELCSKPPDGVFINLAGAVDAISALENIRETE